MIGLQSTVVQLPQGAAGYAHPPMQPGWIDAPHHLARIGDLPLESGETIRDCRVSFVMHGALAADRSNVVLALTAIGSSHHRLDFMIGPGRALDTRRWCVVVVDALGNGLSSSPSNSVMQPLQQFPRFAIRDMVESQRRLLRQVLGIDRLRAVVGASMGGMQALQWGVSLPLAMDAIVAMTPMAKTAPWAAAMNATGRAALTGDPHWAEPGRFSSGLRAWVSLQQLITGRSPAALEQAFADAAQVEAWLDQRVQWQQQQRLAPIDWIWQSHAYDAHDVGATPGFDGDTPRALRAIAARTLVLAPPLDLYNPAFAAREVATTIPGARFEEIPSIRGHQAAGPGDDADVAFIERAVADFMGTVTGPGVPRS